MVEWRQYVAEEKERQLVAIIQEECDRNAERLREQNKAYNEFCETNALKRYDDRLQTAKWNRSEASRAVQAARRYRKSLEKQSTQAYSEKVEAVRQKIKSDDIQKTLNRGNQNKHIKGSKGYIPGKSHIYGDLTEAQRLVDQYHGTGQPVFTHKGEWKQKEIVFSESVMGVNVTLDGLETETRKL